uniref:(California timema) hypothetical protein n=1 Tax=Timema californicum TaxID=61474 RepID=A0A7R9P847_TIMCA|nr:unnamed protein product [Timema californicum]
METSDISHVKQEIVEPIKTKPNNEDGFDMFRISEIKTEDESDTSNSVDEIVETEFKLYDSSFGIMDSKIEHFTAVDKSEEYIVLDMVDVGDVKLKIVQSLLWQEDIVEHMEVERNVKLKIVLKLLRLKGREGLRATQSQFYQGEIKLFLRNEALVVLSLAAEDGEMEARISAELDPLEYVDMTVKSETLESCERESDELKPPEYVDVPVKSEVFESCESESINDLPSLKIKQEKIVPSKPRKVDTVLHMVVNIIVRSVEYMVVQSKLRKVDTVLHMVEYLIVAELRNPEYVNVAVKSETLEICEPESVSSLPLSKFIHEDELKSPEYVDVSVKYEVFETCESESVSGLPLSKIKQELDTKDQTFSQSHTESNKHTNVLNKSDCDETESHSLINKHVTLNKTCKLKECCTNPKQDVLQVVKSLLFDVQPKMEDSFSNEAQQISEIFIKQEIKSEPEAELHPPEFVNMAIKTEIPESCEPESVSGSPSIEDNHEVHYEKTSLANSPIKSEVSDNDIITGLPSCNLPPIFEDNKAEMHPPEFVNMAIKTEIPEICEPESVSGSPSFEDNHEVCYEKTYLVNDPIKKEGSDHDSNDMITGLPSCSLPPVFEDIKNNLPKRYEAPLVHKYCRNDGRRPELENAPEKSGSESAPYNKHESTRKCKTEGCRKFAKNGGHCISHGGNSKTCEVEGCMKYPLKGGRCKTHGGDYNHLKCRTEGCSKYAMKGGHCKPHGGCSKECKVEGCMKYPLKSGLCKAHGGKVHDCLKCKTEGCDKLTQRGGYCVAHGGSSKKCGTEGCTRIARKGGHCNMHGGTRIRYMCKTEGCHKLAQKGGHCISHGGIPKTCKVEGCDNHPLKGGVCRTHGGTFYGRSKCRAEGCSKHALVGGYCKPHGGRSHKCKTEGCDKYPLKGGNCRTHGGTTFDCLKCKTEGCDKFSYKGGHCILHGGRPKKCKTESCTRRSLKGGHCRLHGGDYNNLQCKAAEGCLKRARKGGLCISHGGVSRKCKMEGCDNPSHNTTLRNVNKKEGKENYETSYLKIKTQDRINLRTLKRSKRQALKKKKPDSFSKNNHCKTKGCTNRPRKGGHCRQHGGGVVNYGTCRTDGCPKRPLKGGHCREHGGTSSRKRCRTEGCSKYSLKGGNCRRHGGIYADKTCKTEGCSKWPIKNGRCRQHGGVRTRQICKTEGCNKCPLKNGHCMRHGGIRTRQKCKTEDCSRKPLKGVQSSLDSVKKTASVAYLENALVVLNSTAEDGEIDIRISIDVEDKIIPQTLKLNRSDNFPVHDRCKTEGGYCGQHGEGSRGFRIIKTNVSCGCSSKGCYKLSLKDGNCAEHRGAYIRLPCKTNGCRKWPLSNGHCSEHGGSTGTLPAGYFAGQKVVTGGLYAMATTTARSIGVPITGSWAKQKVANDLLSNGHCAERGGYITSSEMRNEILPQLATGSQRLLQGTR